MNKYVNMLLQIQELETVIKEGSLAVSSGKGKEDVKNELKNDIDGLKQNLPFEVVSSFERILSKYGLAVCPMINAKCTGCSMKLPIGLANNILSDKNCISCPNCGRYLFPDEEHLAHPGDENKQYKGVARFSSLDLMFPKIKASSKEEAIKFMAGKTAEVGFVENGRDFQEALLRREALVSTSIGKGIAFPHARGIKACGLTLAVGTLERPIQENGNEDPLSMIFMSAVPIYSSVFYLELVSKLANYFANKTNRDKLLKGKTPQDLWKIMVLIGR